MSYERAISNFDKGLPSEQKKIAFVITTAGTRFRCLCKKRMQVLRVFDGDRQGRSISHSSSGNSSNSDCSNRRKLSVSRIQPLLDLEHARWPWSKIRIFSYTTGRKLCRFTTMEVVGRWHITTKPTILGISYQFWTLEHPDTCIATWNPISSKSDQNSPYDRQWRLASTKRSGVAETLNSRPCCVSLHLTETDGSVTFRRHSGPGPEDSSIFSENTDILLQTLWIAWAEKKGR